MAEALFLCQGHGLGFVPGLGQHHDPAAATQHAFGGGAPFLVADLDDVGDEVVGDAGLREGAREAGDLRGRRGLALAFEGVVGALSIVTLVLEALPLGGELLLVLAQFGDAGGELVGVAFDHGQALQFVGPLDEGFDGAFGFAGFGL